MGDKIKKIVDKNKPRVSLSSFFICFLLIIVGVCLPVFIVRATGSCDYDITATLNWTDATDFDLYLRKGTPEADSTTLWYGNASGPWWGGDSYPKCQTGAALPEAAKFENQGIQYEDYYVWYNRHSDCNTGGLQAATTASVVINAKSGPLMVNGVSVAKGGTWTGAVPKLNTSGGIPGYWGSGFKITVICTTACQIDADCSDQCSGNNVMSGKCVNGACVSGGSIKFDCAQGDDSHCNGTELHAKGTCEPFNKQCMTGLLIEDCGANGPPAIPRERCNTTAETSKVEQADSVVRGCIESFPGAGPAHCAGESLDGKRRVGDNVTWIEDTVCPAWSTTNPSTGVVSTRTCKNGDGAATVIQDEFRKTCKEVSIGVADCTSNPTISTREKPIEYCKTKGWWTCAGMSGTETAVFWGWNNGKLCSYVTSNGGICMWLQKLYVDCVSGECLHDEKKVILTPGAGDECGDPGDGDGDGGGCNSEKRCVPGGTLGTCNTDFDCRSTMKGCSGKTCQVGGSGAACTTDAQCAGWAKGCDINKKCETGGAYGACNTDIDCQNKLACTTDKKCEPGGGGAPCNTAADCQLLPAGCTINKECKPGGTFGACTTDVDCQNKPACNSNEECKPAGGGIYCNLDIECQSPINGDGCNIDKQCVPGGTYGVCATDADCRKKTACTGDEKCESGGGGIYCETDANCSLGGGCNVNKQCVPGGTYGDCVSDQDCQNMPSCTALETCIAGGDGAYCDTAADCQIYAHGCTIDKQCLPGGIYGTCNNDVVCQNKTACTPSKTCVAGGSGMYCNTNADCNLYPFGCSYDQQCTPGGTYGSCLNSGDCEPVTNLPPEARNLTVGSDYCGVNSLGIPGSGLATFQWTYWDAESDNQTNYQLQISKASGANFEENKVYDVTIKRGAKSGDVVSRGVPVLTSPENQGSPHITFGEKYYWRVKVWEEGGNNSGWVNYTNPSSSPVNTYLFPFSHPSPNPAFAAPDESLPGEVIFSDISRCYNTTESAYDLCSLDNYGYLITYSWWYDVPSSDWFNYINTHPSQSSVIGNSSWNYPVPKTYTAALKVCDDLGCCYAANTFAVRSTSANRVPQWWEISPYYTSQ